MEIIKDQKIINRYLSASEILSLGQSLDTEQYVGLIQKNILLESNDLSLKLTSLLETGVISRLYAIRHAVNFSNSDDNFQVLISWRDLLHPDADFFSDLYKLVLGRDIEEGAPAIWQAQIDSGAMTRAGIILSVAQSEERKAKGPLSLSIDGLTEENTRPLVNIVVADRGWVLDRLAAELERRLPYVTVGIGPTWAPIQYFLPYTAWQGGGGRLNVALFTHLEQDPAMRERFARVCGEMDLAIFMSAPYRAEVETHARNSVRITPGVDPDTFPLRPLRIGVAGRTYGSGRKGEALVARLMALPGIEWHFSGSGWPGPCVMYEEHERHRFFHAIDYLLVPSLYEGGPLPALEALACGTPLIAPEIGFICELPHISYPAGDLTALWNILARLVEERRGRRKSVQRYSWDTWAYQHHTQFQYLLANNELAPAPDLTPAGSRQAPRAALVLHAPEGQGRVGGPVRRVQETVTALVAAGHTAVMHYGDLPNQTRADLIHLFNVNEPNSAVELLESARRRRLPTIFSSIFLDLAGCKAGHHMVEVFREARTFREVEHSLAGLGERYRQAVADRRATFDRILPGYLDQVGRMLAATDHLIATSQFELDLLQDCGLALPPHSIVRNAASEQILSATPSPILPPVIAEGGYILCVGNLEPRKNQLLLALACRDLDRPLVFVGGQNNTAYSNLVRRFSSPWTHFTGHIEDNGLLRAIIENAAALALPSWAEGAPLSVLDAAALGIPLVVSSQSSEREYFGDHAQYCDPWSLGSIREAVQAALDGDTAQSRQERAQFVHSNYNYANIASQLAGIYAAALAGDEPTATEPPLPTQDRSPEGSPVHQQEADAQAGDDGAAILVLRSWGRGIIRALTGTADSET